ncbi:ROK family protein [Paenibacillus sp. FSL R7-0312]|uniref:ROK family protein n=1 Tax=unclassified Paenibacillus TaxID=185978 RepID=UPI0004F60A83|nr:ROK family protein [Paenibacillus sp. FSL R5-0912]AIQ42786.1 transcriptional regulator [Paenibacillus sp. FSL R5-0912]
MVNPSHNTQLVKKINVELVKNILRTSGTGTKASIAGQTRLSVATCGTILNELVQTGEILELGWEESSGGRPARKYQFNANYSLMICMIVRSEGGIQSISYALANLNGEILEQTDKVHEQITVDTLTDWLDQIIEVHPNVQAVGIGIPGVVQQDRIGICDVPALADQPLGILLKERYEEVEIIIENDMNLTVYGLYQRLFPDEERHFAVLTFPKNHFPGAGFMVNGRLLNGNSFFSGEVSYLPYGIPREQQLQLLQKGGDPGKLAIHALVSIISIINPAAIVVTGDNISPEMLEDLRSGCREIIPTEHMPELIIQNDTRREYMAGLITTTMESLTYRFQLVERK